MTMADTVAVMNEGRIEQMGRPEVLYDLPRTAFVANFLGQSNLVPVSVDGTSAGSVMVQANGYRVAIPTDRSNTAGSDHTLGVRPEKVHVHRSAPPAGDNVSVVGPGTVRDVSFTGVSTQYLVDVPGLGSWMAFEQNLDLDVIATRPGDQAWLSFNPGHAFVVSGAAEPLTLEDAS